MPWTALTCQRFSTRITRRMRTLESGNKLPHSKEYHFPQQRMRLLIGMPDPDSLGGPAACEPPFVTELRRLGQSVEEETYVYGEQLTRTSTTRRIRRVLTTAFRLRRQLKTG